MTVHFLVINNMCSSNIKHGRKAKLRDKIRGYFKILPYSISVAFRKAFNILSCLCMYLTGSRLHDACKGAQREVRHCTREMEDFYSSQ